MTPANDKRRKSILTSLFFRDGGAATLYSLKEELMRVHNLPASTDLVNADLYWLDEIGLIRYAGTTAKITERGADVVKENAAWPASNEGWR